MAQAIPSESPVNERKLPRVCLECKDILVEAQLATKFHSSDMQRKRLESRTTPANSKFISVAPEGKRVGELEKQLQDAEDRILKLKMQLKKQQV